ncbi:MAG: tail fiber domain-containing protein [Flavobacteriaceae bacterium]
MKNIITPLLLCIGLSVNAQLTSVTEGGNTGQRLSVSNAANHGDIGDKAVDLSYSGVTSTTLGATGVYSTAMGYQTTASGSVSTAMGYITTASGTLSTASGDYSTASGYASTAMGGDNVTASGNWSTAMGRSTTSSGIYSTAMGAFTTASGQASTAMGESTTASGYAATAMGRATTASGGTSIAMGYNTTASDFASLVVGQYNSSGSSATSSDSFSFSAPAFVIGNGTDSGSRSDAFKVMFNGDAYVSNSLYLGGTQITSTATELNLLSGVTSLGTGILEPVTENGNTGVRLSTSNAANHGDIGSNAVDLSYSVSSSTTRGATGNYSTAMGYATQASDYAAVIIGQYNSSGSTATSAGSFSESAPAFVIGNGTSSGPSDAFKVMFNGDTYVSNSLYLGGTEITSTATELNLLSGVTALGTGILEPVTENGNTGVRLSSSDAANHGDIGDKAVDLSYSDSASSIFGATGQYSVTMGLKATANGNVSTAMGSVTTASGYVSTAMGINTTASGVFSTAMGAGTTASGNVSTAMGEGTEASDYASTVIGQFNSSGSTATSASSFSLSAPAFVIGNGTGSGSRSDAFKVMFNGDATVSNDLTVNGNVTVSSDARLKANIVSLGATLSKLLNIDGKTYTVKKNGAQKIGVLAQDIQEVFPELVSEDNEGMLSVNYQGLIPVLINALKEQEQKFQAQEERLKALERILFKE